MSTLPDRSDADGDHTTFRLRPVTVRSVSEQADYVTLELEISDCICETPTTSIKQMSHDLAKHFFDRLRTVMESTVVPCDKWGPLDSNWPAEFQGYIENLLKQVEENHGDFSGSLCPMVTADTVPSRDPVDMGSGESATGLLSSLGLTISPSPPSPQPPAYQGRRREYGLEVFSKRAECTWSWSKHTVGMIDRQAALKMADGGLGQVPVSIEKKKV